MADVIPGKIYKAIIECKRRIGPIAKKGIAPDKAGGWSYRQFDDVANAVSPLLDELGIIVSPRVTKCEHRVDGTKRYTYVEVEYEWIAEDGSRITSSTVGEAFDMADKSSTKAQTVAYRTVLCQMLNIPFEDMKDPEAAAGDSGQWSDPGLNVRKVLSDLKAVNDADVLRKIVMFVAKRGGFSANQIALCVESAMAAGQRVGYSEEQLSAMEAYMRAAAGETTTDAPELPEATVERVSCGQILAAFDAAGTQTDSREAAIVLFLRSYRLGHIDSSEFFDVLCHHCPETTGDNDVAGYLVQAIHYSTGLDELSQQSETLHTARQQSRIGKEVYDELCRYCQYQKTQVK